MSWSTYLAVFAVVCVGSTVQVSVGMGHGLIAAPLLRALHSPLLPGPIVIAAFFVSLGLAARNSHRGDIGVVVPALIGRVFGTGIAIALLATASERGLSIVIGAFVLGFVMLRVLGARIARTTRTLAAAGVASGVGGTIAALGGAPMGLLYEQHAKARDFRGPMGLFLTVGAVISLVSLVAFGELDGDAALLGLTLLPPIAVGFVLSRWVTPIVDRGLLRPAVFGLSGGSAVLLIATELV